MYDFLLRFFEKRSAKKLGGVPLLWMIYKPDQPIPNMIFKLHPSIEQDEYLNKQFKEISDYLREKYCDEWEYLK